MKSQPFSSKPVVIGVRDSGVGGLTVAREIKRLLPHCTLLYFADTAHVPYGDRTPEEVRFFALAISRFLIEQGAQILVFACNTTSAHALPDAQKSFSQPVIGMIEPGAQAAILATKNHRIGVLATQATVNSGIYTRVMQQLQPASHILEVACPDFVPLVENEQTRSQAAREASCKYLQPLLSADVDTVVLGCTHYPLLLPMLREAAPQVTFVDPARAVAVEVASRLHEIQTAKTTQNSSAGSRCFVSGEADGVRHWLQELLPDTELQIEYGPIFEMEAAELSLL